MRNFIWIWLIQKSVFKIARCKWCR